MSEAASVTFFALLSLFPAITALVSIYGLFTDPSTIQAHLDSVSGFIPSGGMQIIEEQVKRLTQSPPSGLSVGAAVGILAALWSANQGAKAMLGAVIGFMTWIWLSSTVLLLGAQVNAEMETQTSRDTTVGGEKPPGARGANAADTVV